MVEGLFFPRVEEGKGGKKRSVGLAVGDRFGCEKGGPHYFPRSLRR